jgi:hypothetical protein
MSIDPKTQKQLLPLRDTIAEHFAQEDWLEPGVLTGTADAVQGHARLLRSLSWGDPDYAGNVLDILLLMVKLYRRHPYWQRCCPSRRQSNRSHQYSL